MFSHQVVRKGNGRYDLAAPTCRVTGDCLYHGWVAEITGRCERYGLKRKFPKKAWNIAGQEMFWELQEGRLYQYSGMYVAGEGNDSYARNFDADDSRRKGFFRIAEGRLEAVSRDDVSAHVGI
jgi:hypothetical protein